MDDDRLRARLKHAEGPIDLRIEFVETLHDELADRLGLPGTGRPAARTRPTRAVVRRTGLRRWAMLAVAATLVVATVAVSGVGSALLRFLDQPTLIQQIETSGTLRVLVRADHPQVQPTAGALDGFDIAVAAAVADRLGVVSEPVVSETDQLPIPGVGGTVIAMPSRAIPPNVAAGLITTLPYYRWPVYVAVRAGADDATTLDDLVGRRICVVRESAGVAWLTSASAAAGIEAVSPPPRGAVAVVEASDAACLDALARSAVDAVVTAHLLPGDLAATGVARELASGPVAREPAAILVTREGPDANGLRERIDSILDDLRRDGTLAGLSRRWFGGEDLTRP
jgi:ABC-type amino acid transport substrate-binding protein